MIHNTDLPLDPPLLTNGADPVILTYDSNGSQCSLISTAGTCDFVYRGRALDLTQDDNEKYLPSHPDKHPSTLFNALGKSSNASSDDILADAVHDDCTYKPPRSNDGVEMVKLQDWVKQNLKGYNLNDAFWTPLTKLLKCVDNLWVGDGNSDGTNKRAYYALTIRAVRFEDIKVLGVADLCWHTEWWTAEHTDAVATSSSATKDLLSSYRRPSSYQSPDDEPPTPTTPPSSRRQSGLADSSDEVPPSPSPSGHRRNLHVDVLRTNTLNSNHSTPPGYISSPPGQFTSPTTPTSCTLSPGDDFADFEPPIPPLRFDRPAKPRSPYEISSSSCPPCPAPPPIRIMAPLAGPGTLFSRDGVAKVMNVMVAGAWFPDFGRGGAQEVAVFAPERGEMAVWMKGAGYGPCYAAPTVGCMGGRDRVFVSMVVGTEEQVGALAGGF
ncbi:hypothetical protein B0J12DRAFT_702232 [Macrophomina phaseolina]|uniref:Uncharacterized protein n=1 Tax=Macrophomina phaseolina TaxID=35725 RepID=A0ABQ8G4Q9_9PEZI|nr:hypothetical protein B0J12DRAFT_702232 [Macrophomina phaseolina]